MITRKQLINKYIKFFESKKHKNIPSASLIPENDPTVLFTTAGMHPLVPFLSGQKHPLGKRLVNVQKCIRTGDIEEVGDTTHHTFFEMLGNWSLGDYWKKEAIQYSLEFLTKEIKISKNKLTVTCFKGDTKNKIPKDNESAKIWKSLGIKKIKFLDKKENWWGPAGETGPCGPDTEIFVNNVEIWNDVFMEYNKTKSGKYLPLSQKNVDTGMGVERTLAILNKLDDNYLTPLFLPIIKEIEKLSGKKYKGNEKSMRIIADHIKAATFILGDEKGISPSNVGQGYVLRRLIRRAIVHANSLGIKENFSKSFPEIIIKIYPDYKELQTNRNFILKELEKEENKFRQTLERGLNKFKKFSKNKKISGKEGFLLFQSFGLPVQMINELAKKEGIKFDTSATLALISKHQQLSRTASAGKFKSGLADHSERTIKLHTAAHLMHAAIQKVLDPEAKQKGSNITPERLRFDFAFDRKLTDKEKKEIEDFVNDKIKRKLEVTREEMPLKKAFSSGAQGEFGHKYPEIVSVYTIKDPKEKSGYCSKEICTGPHVKNTNKLGKFKIIKETSCSSGVRRIKATIEN